MMMLCTLAILAATVFAAKVPTTSLVSPALPDIDSKRIRLDFPTGVSIVRSDPVNHWYAHYYEFDISVRNGKHVVLLNGLIDRIPVVRFGNLRHTGRALRTVCGVRGRYSANRAAGEWRLAVKANRTMVVEFAVFDDVRHGTGVEDQVLALFRRFRVSRR
jgi:hypothetical protein